LGNSWTTNKQTKTDHPPPFLFGSSAIFFFGGRNDYFFFAGLLESSLKALYSYFGKS